MVNILVGCEQSDTITKESVEAYIEAHWQETEYGYSEKPTKYIALSFDDGPCGPSGYGGTEALLNTLDELKIKATFFMIGINISNNKDVAQAVFAAGHEIGSHSYDHSRLGSLSENEITENLCAASALIWEITGKEPALFRAPYLDHGANLSEVCGSLGMALIDGNSHNDWPGSAEAIKNSVLANPKDGEIILLHENNTSKGNTMSALPEIAAGLRKKGFWIMTVSELAAIKDTKLQAGVRYGLL